MSFLGKEEALRLLYKHRDNPLGAESAHEESFENKHIKDENGTFILRANGSRIQQTVVPGEDSEIRRNAEHYLESYYQVTKNPEKLNQYWYGTLTGGYAAWKAVPNALDKGLKVASFGHQILQQGIGLTNPGSNDNSEIKWGYVPPGTPRSSYRFTPVTMDEINAGFAGARDAYDNYHKEQQEIKEAVTQIIKDEIPTLRDARLETLLNDLDGTKAMIAHEANISMDRIDIELLKYSGYIPLGDDITPSSIANHLEQTGHFKDLSISVMEKFYPKELDYAIEHGNVIAEAIKELGADETRKIENFSEWKDQKLEKTTIETEHVQPSQDENQLNLSSNRSDFSIESGKNGTVMNIGNQDHQMDFHKVQNFNHYINGDRMLLGKFNEDGDFTIFHRNKGQIEEVATIENFAQQNLISLEENVRSQTLFQGKNQDQGRDI